jgi:WD40 repeat protein
MPSFEWVQRSNDGDPHQLRIMIIALVSLALAQPPKPPVLPTINASQARLEQTLPGLTDAGTAIAVDEPSGLVFAATENGRVHCWPRAAWLGVRNAVSSPDQFRAHDGPILAMVLGGGTLATAGADRKIKVWGLDHQAARQTIETAETVRTLAITRDGKRIAMGDDSNTITIIDAANGKAVSSLKGHTDWLLALDFSADGTQLVSGGYDGQLLIWDVSNGSKRVGQLQPPPPPKGPPNPSLTITSVAFRDDGKVVAAGTSNGAIVLVNVTDGKLVRTMTGHTSVVTGLRFHPAGNLLVSSAKDRAVKFWNADNGQPFASLDNHAAWVLGVSMLEKGTRFATIGVDGTVRIWDLTPKK